MRIKHVFLMVVLALVIGITIGITLPKLDVGYGRTGEIKPSLETQETLKTSELSPLQITKREVTIVGIDENGKGVTAKLIAEIKSGSGLVLVNINNVLADYYTQLSARTAAQVASNITKINLNHTDIIYNILTPAAIIGGPSAGSSFAVVTIAALQNKTIKQNVIITGTINENGDLIGVGGILEKAKAAKDAGATIFLIPEADYTTGYEEEKSCAKFNGATYCEIKYKPKKAELSSILNIETHEIKNIVDSLPYLLEDKASEKNIN